MPTHWPVTSRAASEARKGTRRGAVLGGAEALALAQEAGQRLAALPQRLDVGREGGDGLGHRGGGDRHDRVDGDAGLGQLHRPGTGHRGDARLGGGVVGLPEVAALAGGRAHQDQAAALALLPHADGGGAGTGERTPEMGGDDGVEVVVGHLPQHAVAQDARVGDEHVEPAELADGAGDQAVGGLGGADGDGLGDGAGAGAPQRLGGPLGGFGVDVVDDDGGAGRGEGGGVRESEARPEPVTTATLPVRSRASGAEESSTKRFPSTGNGERRVHEAARARRHDGRGDLRKEAKTNHCCRQ